ncbi:glycosyltransferase [Aurantivibrio plasticivorans]
MSTNLGKSSTGWTSGLVSVIVPCFNGEKYIESAIDSLKKQTYPHWECIVVSDGSTDGSAKIIEKLAAEDSRIVAIINNINQGVSACRNEAILKSKGEYLAFLDADDLWHPEKLQRQVQVFESYPNAGVVPTASTHIDGDGEPVKSRKEKAHTDLKQGRITLIEMLAGDIPFSISTMTRRECVNKVGLFNTSYKIGEDYELWLRILQYYEYYYIFDELLMYRVHDSNATGNKLRNREYKIQILEDIKQSGTWAVDKKAFDYLLQRKYNSLGKLYVRKKRVAKAIQCFEKAKQLSASQLQSLKATLWLRYLRFRMPVG